MYSNKNYCFIVCLFFVILYVNDNIATELSNEYTCPCKTVEVYYDKGEKRHPILGNYEYYHSSTKNVSFWWRQINSVDYWILWNVDSWYIGTSDHGNVKLIANLDRKGLCPYDYTDWDWRLYKPAQQKYVTEKGLRVKCSSTSK